ncbi:Uncharacterised protein [Serratia fonticola]|uniref:Uncharacterized protein n=1 Tax=Serratia fonticola TaxID=47917 RepID=A0A4U9UCG8_SERFO|nr:Uncharacterised protein [Serratia fonticola]
MGDALYWMMGENEAAIHQYWVEKPWKKGIEDDYVEVSPEVSARSISQDS